MSYFHHMLRILSFDEAVYREVISHDKRSLFYTLVNVAFFGIFYGLSALYFTRFLTDSSGSPIVVPAAMRFTLLLMGMSIAFLIHGGMALFSWGFCRGFGGSTLFLPIYLALGMAWIAFWPLAPFLAALQVKQTGNVFLPTLAAAAAFALAVVFRALKSASGLSTLRMLLTLVVIIVYICCFLYLWVG
jgi:hypothetical protein